MLLLHLASSLIILEISTHRRKTQYPVHKLAKSLKRKFAHKIQILTSKLRKLKKKTSYFISYGARCLKFTEKVSFSIASEASYVYILCGQKLIKKCQKWSNLASFWKPKACSQIELPDRSVLIGQKLVESAKIQKFKCDILGDFQTLCGGFFRAKIQKCQLFHFFTSFFLAWKFNFKVPFSDLASFYEKSNFWTKIRFLLQCVSMEELRRNRLCGAHMYIDGFYTKIPIKMRHDLDLALSSFSPLFSPFLEDFFL